MNAQQSTAVDPIEVIDVETGEVTTTPTNGSLVKYEEKQLGAVPYHKVSEIELSPAQIEKLLAPIDDNDVEIRPDGILYFPEIKYRKTLNRSIGPGKWALVPRNISIMENNSDRNMSIIAYNGDMFVNGCYASNATGEQKYYPENSQMSYATACEGAKSDCMVRCCKDLGIASELWDPVFIERWKKEKAVQVWCENAETKKKKPLWRRKDRSFIYPWKESGAASTQQNQDGEQHQSTETTTKEIPFPTKHPGKGWDELDDGLLKWAAEKTDGDKQKKAKAEIERRKNPVSQSATTQTSAGSGELPKKNSDLFTAESPSASFTEEQQKEISELESVVADMIDDADVLPRTQAKALHQMWTKATTYDTKKTAYDKIVSEYGKRKKK
jgi:hypothetical protein